MANLGGLAAIVQGLAVAKQAKRQRAIQAVLQKLDEEQKKKDIETQDIINQKTLYDLQKSKEYAKYSDFYELLDMMKTQPKLAAEGLKTINPENVPEGFKSLITSGQDKNIPLSRDFNIDASASEPNQMTLSSANESGNALKALYDAGIFNNSSTPRSVSDISGPVASADQSLPAYLVSPGAGDTMSIDKSKPTTDVNIPAKIDLASLITDPNAPRQATKEDRWGLILRAIEQNGIQGGMAVASQLGENPGSLNGLGPTIREKIAADQNATRNKQIAQSLANNLTQSLLSGHVPPEAARTQASALWQQYIKLGVVPEGTPEPDDWGKIGSQLSPKEQADLLYRGADYSLRRYGIALDAYNAENKANTDAYKAGAPSGEYFYNGTATSVLKSNMDTTKQNWQNAIRTYRSNSDPRVMAAKTEYDKATSTYNAALQAKKQELGAYKLNAPKSGNLPVLPALPSNIPGVSVIEAPAYTPVRQPGKSYAKQPSKDSDLVNAILSSAQSDGPGLGEKRSAQIKKWLRNNNLPESQYTLYMNKYYWPNYHKRKRK